MSQIQLNAARRITALFAEAVNANFSLELWNEEILPLGINARQDVRIKISGPYVIRRLLLSPKLLTVFELYATGDLDLIGVSPLEIINYWDHMRLVSAAKTINKWALLKDILPFLFSNSQGTKLTSTEAFDTKIASKLDMGRKDSELIKFHYDISNHFYSLFLDTEMVYSSAYFQDENTTLEEAQVAKLDMICRRLRLKPDDYLLDIGCGWGALLCHAVKNYSVRAHGVTLSQAQFDFVKQKLNRLGIADKVKLELKDYRSIEGAEIYDKIAQIEMFEHVGIDNHDHHFLFMRKLLKPRGLYLHQASTRRATRNPKIFRKPTGYMQVIHRYIFPGGELDHIGMTLTNLERLGFEVHDVEAWREHFQRTSRVWAERLWARKEEGIAEIGLARTRLWLLYLAMVSIGFERGSINVFQTLASKRRLGASGVPLTRRDLYRQ